MKENSIIYIILFFIFTSCSNNENNSNEQSVYDYNNNQIAGSPIIINIFEEEKIIYKIESDTLIDSIGNILLSGGVNVKVFNDDNIKINDIFSNKALVYTGSDSMKAYGDVKIISVQNKDELYTEKIILYNKTRLVRSNEKVVFVNNLDTIRGVGFWSDFEMENWTIDKVSGSLNKEDK
tara:strand:- start:240 stop:776 length:537 start_codon:yes stop_codon:yes gene_type:complete